MKFLTIGTFKDTYSTIPQADRQKLGVSQYEYNLDTKKKMGDKFHMYSVPGWDHRLVFITELNNVEELAQLFQGAPVVAAGFFKYESYPLIELDIKAFEAALASLKAAK
jgi:hypothetical protein